MVHSNEYFLCFVLFGLVYVGSGGGGDDDNDDDNDNDNDDDDNSSAFRTVSTGPRPRKVRVPFGSVRKRIRQGLCAHP